MNKLIGILLSTLFTVDCMAQESTKIQAYGKLHECEEQVCHVDMWHCSKEQLEMEKTVIYFPFNKKSSTPLLQKSREGTKLIWILSNFKNPIHDFGVKMSSAQTLVEIDCEYFANRIRQIHTFEEWFANNKQSSVNYPYGKDWNYPVPNDEFYQLAEMVCKPQ